MPKTTFVVTFPDGTTATRTSGTMAYTHAVIATRSCSDARAEYQAEADQCRVMADKYIGSEKNDEYGHRMRAREHELIDRRDACIGPQYGVFRWSLTPEAAHKYASSAEMRLFREHRGWEASVVPVTVQAKPDRKA